MPATLIIMPGSPALVPKLVPRDPGGARLLSRLSELFDEFFSRAETSIELVSSHRSADYTSLTGSFRAWGAPEVKVSAGNYLPELLQRFVLGRYEALVDKAGTRPRVEPVSDHALTLMVLDGSIGLSPRAPATLLDTAEETHQWCCELLSGEKVSEKRYSDLLDGGIREPELWLELHALKERVQSATLHDSDTSLGVGRYVAEWIVEDEWSEKG